ncbi:hypothetical protein [Streptomyces sp. NRRL S-31]|uniref:deoxynucleotide monophosphate kinase family protein n=1 Tax=Streptomyces sp. NRRL S-31 TaxID=1463898 RepID=UPI0004C927F0|nr:hypothetical protein [Streptomyces sp. NRRL S-31]
MSYQNIAFVGKARSGKDTAGERLVQHWMFTRLAFADPLKRMALQVDPLIPMKHLDSHARLSACVTAAGWEDAKDRWPEIRRVLQRMGHTVRELDPDFWVRALMDKAKAADGWNMPVVVTDCRYRNEAETLRAAGFRLVRIKRPTPLKKMRREALHPSETELDGYPCDDTIINAGSVFDLHTAVDALVRRR